MRKKLLASLLAIVMLLGTLLTGCASGGNAPADTKGEAGGTTASNAAEPAGDGVAYRDTIRVGVRGDQDNLDPQNNRTNNIVVSQIYNRLVKRDINNELVPDLAESWEVSDDELVWTFHLRKGVKFQNGADFTSRDVKATIDRTIDREHTVNTSAAMNIISEAKIVDDYTIQLITEKPVGPFLQTLAGNLGGMIMCADIIEKYGEDIGYSPETVVGTGPYKLVEWNKEENMKLDAFDDYWEGEPTIKHVEFISIPDNNARAVALETDQVDLIVSLPAGDVDRINSIDGLHVELKDSMAIHHFMFNMSREKLQDPRIRQAILLSVDDEKLVNALFGELGETPCTAPCSPLYFGYVDLGVQPYDPARAKELLAEAGYPNGIEITIMTCAAYNKGVEMAEVIKDMAADAGITVNIEVLEMAAFSAAMASDNPEDKPWDMWIMGMGNMVLDFSELRNAFRSTAEGTDKPNGSFYSNKEFDELVDTAAYTTDENLRMECYKRAAEIIWWDDPGSMFINYRKGIYGLNDRVLNFEANVGSEMNFWQMQVLDQ